jgi:hypothetical protein
MSATLSITETQIFISLRSALLTFGLAPADPSTSLSIIRGQVNRVPEPAGPDFVVMWPISDDRLSMNVETMLDSNVTGSIAGNVLAVTAVGNGSLSIGAALWPFGASAPIATVLKQLTGLVGGVGTYQLTTTPNAASAILYCGTRAMEEDTEVTIQCDVHGPASHDNARLIETQWRSQWGVDACAA